jgi:tetratricopeptide (TPR) repeat protein
MFGALHGEQLAAAEKAFRRALAIRERLVADFPAEPAYCLNLAQSYDALGQLLTDPYRAPGRYDEAEAFLDKAVNLLKRLVADYPPAPEYQMELAHSYQSLGILLEERGRAREAEQAYRQGIACYKALPPNSASAAYRRGLAQLLNNLGNSLDRTGQTQEAQEVGRQSVEEYKRLVAEFPTTPGYRNSLALALNNQGIRLRDQQPEEACRLLEEACAEQRAALQANPRGRFYRGHLVNHSTNLADTLVQLGKHGRAAEVVVELTRTFPEDLTPFALAGNCLAHCALLAEKDNQLSEAERKALAQRYAVRAKQMFGQALKWTENRSPHQGLKLNRLAWFLATCPVAELRDPAGAVACARKAVGLSPKAGDHWNTLGVALYRAGDWKEAVAALQKSMDLRKGGDSNDWFFLAMAQWQLGDKEQACKWYDQAVQWMEKHKPQDEELRRFRAEAAALLKVEDRPKEKPE